MENNAKRVVLINPEISPEYRAVKGPFVKLAPNSTLALLACETERRIKLSGLPTPLIEVYDRPLVDEAQVSEWATAHLVGFTTWFSNYRAAVEIARAIKEKNPAVKVVFGGPEATNLGRPNYLGHTDSPDIRQRVLRNQESVDYVVCGDGESSLWRLVAGREEEFVPNLWYRNDKGVPVYTGSAEVVLDELGVFDFRHFRGLDLCEYDARRSGYAWDPQREPLTISWTRGCRRAMQRGKRCAYCSIFGSCMRLTPPACAWRQVRHLRELYGAEAFFESGDDFSADQYAEELADHTDRQENIRLRCFSSFDHITEEKVSAFKRLGIYEIYFGLDNTDPQINQWSGHKLSEERVFEAMALMEKNGIEAILAVMFGLPGETTESLGRAESLVERLVAKYSNIRMFMISLAVPLVGSRWFQQLASDPAVRSEYGEKAIMNSDCLDYMRLSSLSIRHYCRVSEETILDAMARIRTGISGKTDIGSYGALDERWSHKICSDFDAVTKEE